MYKLDKLRICVNTQFKSSIKQLKLNVCVSKSNSVDRYAITCDVICVPFGPFRFHLCNIQMPVGYWFFLLASPQYNSNYMNKISPPVKYFSGKTLQNGCEQLMSTRQWDLLHVKYKNSSLILRKADDESKYVGTFVMTSFNKKMYVITAKNVA